MKAPSKNQEIEARVFKNILALKTPEQKIIGFHASNLELAELDEETWQTFNKAPNALIPGPFTFPTLPETSAKKEIEQWNQENFSEVHDFIPSSIRSISINVSQVCNLKC
ncbi:MAG: hypothetical protein D6797_00855, partial [Bdellovibrio sp.]